MSVKIISDSGCDLPVSIINELDIDVMPLLAYLDDIEYKDGQTISYEEFYKNMREGSIVRTAQVPMDLIEDKFNEYLNCGEDVLYISFSSGLSGTFQTAKIVQNDIINLNNDYILKIFDSKCASLGYGLVVYYVAKLAKQGASIDEIIEKTKFYSTHLEHIFTVDDLEYLYRGGRVSKGTAAVGSMLNIKPILDVKDGKLVPLQKMHGRKKVFRRIIEIMKERGVSLDNQVIAISHGDDLKAANILKEMIIKEFGSKEFIINTIGCAIGAHSGPGTLAVFFLNKIEKF